MHIAEPSANTPRFDRKKYDRAIATRLLDNGGVPVRTVIVYPQMASRPHSDEDDSLLEDGMLVCLVRGRG